MTQFLCGQRQTKRQIQLCYIRNLASMFHALQMTLHPFPVHVPARVPIYLQPWKSIFILRWIKGRFRVYNSVALVAGSQSLIPGLPVIPQQRKGWEMNSQLPGHYVLCMGSAAFKLEKKKKKNYWKEEKKRKKKKWVLHELMMDLSCLLFRVQRWHLAFLISLHFWIPLSSVLFRGRDAAPAVTLSPQSAAATQNKMPTFYLFLFFFFVWKWILAAAF